MNYSPLEISTGPLETGVILGSFQWEDGYSAGLLGIMWNQPAKMLFILVFFKVIAIPIGDVEEDEMD